MKKLTFFLCAVFLTMVGTMHGNETFAGSELSTVEGIGASGSYQESSWTTHSGENRNASDVTFLLQALRNADWATLETFAATESLATDYCAAGASTVEAITSVLFAGINNNTSATTGPGYEDFTSIVANVEPGGSYTMSLQGNTSGSYTCYFTVFIDWNQNGSLNDAGEMFTIGSVTSSNGSDGKIATSTIDVPMGAVVGATRMRVRKNFNSAYTNPCGNVSYGQVEDYTVMVGTLDNCANATAGTLTTQDMSICAGNPFTLEAEGASEPADGLTRQWMSSVDGGINWTAIDGATDSSYSVSDGISEETQFKYVVSCVHDNSNDETGVVVISLNPNASECYCIPEGTNVTRYFSSFTTSGGSENITNGGSGFSPGGYGDFTAMEVQQGPGGMVNFEANIMGGTAGFRIWVDWNQDGDFDTTEEVAYASGGYLNTHTGSFTVPSTAMEGPTRMRIVSHWLSGTGSIDPCATGFTYGEFEDYTFVVSNEAAWDCPAIEANYGDPCDDGDPNTIDDIITENCECAGTVPPDGMVCEAPLVITSLPYTTTDNTSNYGDDYESGDFPPLAPGAIGSPSKFYLGGDDVVYSYTPTANGVVDISVTDHGTWAGVFVFTGCAPFESTVGGFTSSSGTDPLEVIGLTVNAGTTYYIVISTNAAPQSTPYTLTVTESEFDCPELEANYGSPCDDGNPNTVNDTVNENCECEGIPIATNDEACTATALACGDTIEQSLIGATESLDDSCNGTGTADVWFSFVSDGSQIVTVSETSSFDAVVQLFIGTDCGALEEAGACKDSPENYTVTEAGTYYFRVRPYSSANNSTLR